MRQLILGSLLFSLVACDPVVMIRGGKLSGETRPVPGDWSFADEVETVQLETRPEAPYSVNIWGVSFDGNFYVVAGKPDNAWAGYIAVDDRVRLRIDETIYEMRAERDDTPEARERFLAAAKAKYDFEPESEEASEAILFRLVAR
jgi:hypothetical protein